jgi:hypothetical protein
MIQQTSVRLVYGFGKWAIAATVLMGFALTTGVVSGKAIAAELPTEAAPSELPVSDRSADLLGEPMQVECVVATSLQSRPDCATGGELFLHAESENESSETVVRFDFQEVTRERSEGVTLFRFLF